MSEEEFSNNPFKLALKGGRFPNKGTAGRDAERHARDMRKYKKQVVGSQEDEQDMALFLTAMSGVEKENGSGKTVKGKGGTGRFVSDGFAMGEQCDLGVVKPLAKDKRRRKANAYQKPATVTSTGGLAGLSGVKVHKADSVRRSEETAGADPSDAQTYAQRLSKKAVPSRVGVLDRLGKTESSPAQEFQPAAEPDMAALLDGRADDTDFAKAMQDVMPLNGKGRDINAPAPELVNPASIEEILAGKLEFAVSQSENYVEAHVVGLDLLTVTRLTQGCFDSEATLDLHGLNVLQSFESLRGFLRNAWFRGLRCVTLIPGRGNNSPDGIGILREKLSSWLIQEPFKPIVLAFCTAQQKDGGTGSLYLLLRKFKKKARVNWERMPADEDLL